MIPPVNGVLTIAKLKKKYPIENPARSGRAEFAVRLQAHVRGLRMAAIQGFQCWANERTALCNTWPSM